MIDDAEARRALEAGNRFGSQGHPSIEPIFIDQNYLGYTAENQQTWQRLFTRQRARLEASATSVFLEGAERIALGPGSIPDLSKINTRLTPITGWRSRAVPGYIPPHAFFACLAERCFPTTVVIRPAQSIGYLPEPDIFHDVFGHVPLHADPFFSDFLQVFGEAAFRARDPEHLLRLTRLFWFTVEFGLIRERGELKLYGSGLISSPEEAARALESDSVRHLPFDLETVCETPFEIDHFQPVLFVLEDFAQLRDAMASYADKLENLP